MKLLANLNLLKNELQNARIQNLASAPSSPVAGQIYYDTGTNQMYYWNGSTWVSSGSTSTVTSVGGTSPINSTGGSSPVISIDAATSSVPGSMSAADKAKLDAATNVNTASTIVMRDSSNNFSAGTITANLTGTASSATNASNLNSQAASYYLSRANHTGTQLASTISDFDTQVRTSRLDQMAAPTSAVSLNSQRITGLATPSVDSDAATKGYVDATKQGLTFKDAVRVATTTNLAATRSSNILTATSNGSINDTGIDSVTNLAVNDRILVKNQSTGADNGPYIVTTVGDGSNPFVLTRSVDFDSSSDAAPGSYFFINEGTTQGDSAWVLSTNAPITLNTTSLTFIQFSGAAQITAGAALSKTGNTLDVNVDDSTIEISSDALRLKAPYGARIFNAQIGDGSTTDIVVTHNFGTRRVSASVRRVVSPYDQVLVDNESTTTNTITFKFTTAPSTNEYDVQIFG